MPSDKLRRMGFLISLYGALPFALLLVMLAGWMMALENATLVLQSADSPDGRYRVEVVREDPGVSSGYEYMVRVMPAGLTPFAKSLRVLRFGPVYAALEAHREPDQLTVEWTEPREVMIRCKGCGGASVGRERWGEIALRYEMK